jgi:polyisoprenoid-binding protein YceI
VFCLFFCVFYSPARLQSEPAASGFKSYELDTSHTKVGFEIAHLIIATVEGRFNEFSGSFDYDEQKNLLRNARIEIKAASIDTNEPDRDKHLRSPDFFDVAKFPRIVFEDIKLSAVAGKPQKLEGTITMHGVKKPLEFAVDFKGTAVDPWGNAKMIFELRGELMRKDFDLKWNKNLDKGGVMIGDSVKLIMRVEAQAKKK